MLLDKYTQFSVAQNPAGTEISDNVLDLGIARDISGAVSESLFLMIKVATAFTSLGSATMQVFVETAPDDGSGGQGSYVVIYESPAIAVASLVAGYSFLPGQMLGVTQRWVRLRYGIAVAGMTAGTINASLVPSLDVQPVYASGYDA